MDWASYLEQLQTIHQEFNTDAVILEPILTHLFCGNLRLSIHTQAK